MEDIASRLASEILVILFRAFPGRFVLVGGGALHWIFHSPRLSADIDLKPIRPGRENDVIREISEVLSEKLPSVAAALGVTVKCRADPGVPAVRILVDGRVVLRVELASLTPVTGREKHLFQSNSLQSEIVITPDIHQLLFAKAAALAKRAHVKGRDVFDIWFLLGLGAILDTKAFADWLHWEELDAADLEGKLAQITPSRLRADLDRFLPDSIRQSLAQENDKALIDAARRLFKPFR
jgi:hypothetical protein